MIPNAAVLPSGHVGPIFRASSSSPLHPAPLQDVPACPASPFPPVEDDSDSAAALTPASLLFAAALAGDTDTLSKLLESGLHVDTVSPTGGETPLWIASYKGHEAAVCLLLQYNPDVLRAPLRSGGVPPLWIAAQEGHAGVVRCLLQHPGGDRALAPHCCNCDGSSALWIAALMGHLPVVDCLLDFFDRNRTHAGLDTSREDRLDSRAQQRAVFAVDQACNSGLSPLWVAAQRGHAAVVARLAASGANVAWTDAEGTSALWIAAQEGHVDVVRSLVQLGAPVDNGDCDGMTALLIACQEHREDVVRVLLESGANPNLPDTSGQTPLWAVLSGHSLAAAPRSDEIMQLLFAHGACMSAHPKTRVSLLWTAAQEGLSSVVELLLARGAAVNELDAKYGLSPLWISLQMSHYDTASVLLRYHADPNLANSDGVSALWSCAQEGDIQALELLLAAGADVNQLVGDTSPLFIALQERMSECASLLLRNGADVSVLTQEQYSALFIAACVGDVPNMRILLSRGAKVNELTAKRLSPLWIASQNGHLEAVELLLRAGADPRQLNLSGASALDIARQQNFAQIVALLEQALLEP